MNEQILLARRFARMVWPHRWVALVASAALSLVGWAVTYSLPNVYQVDAKIFIDTHSMLRPLLKGLAVESDSLASTSELLRRTLLTRPNLESVARKTDLDLQTKTAREFDAVVTTLAANVSLIGTSRDNVFQIVYTDSDKKRAKLVVDELLNTFLEAALGSNRRDTAATRKFLDEQVAEYEQRLLEAEQRLKEFKQKNVGQMPDEGSSYFKSLQSGKTNLRASEQELQETRNRAASLHAQADRAPMQETPGAPGGPTTQFDARIAKLQDQLDQLLLLYTDKHPDVTGIRSQLVSLRELQAEDLKSQAAAQSSAGEAGTTNTPRRLVDPELQLAIAQADGQISALMARVAFQKREITELEKAVDTIPEIEAELTRLDRDYGLNKEQYDELQKRREAARLSEDVDQQADTVKLKVIEPPRIPLSPVGPNRIRFMSLALAAGLAIGAGLAFLFSQISPRFYSADELKDVTHLPVMGSVSMVFSEQQRSERRMELAVFSLVLLGLFSVFGALVALESLNFDLKGQVVAIMRNAA